MMFGGDKVKLYRPQPQGNRVNGSAIPSFHTTSNSALNEPHCATLAAKRAIDGTSLPAGMGGIRS